MRTDSARLALIFCLTTATLVGCQSGPRWDWWRSAKNTQPGGSALANATPYQQPPLPSANAGANGTNPALAASSPYNPTDIYPATPYPSPTVPAGASPSLAGRSAPASWTTGPAGPTPGVNSVYPSPAASGLAQAPSSTQPQTIYPTTGASGGLMAPQAGQYNNVYGPTGGDALAKAPTAAAAGATNPADRYSNDSSTGDRFASNPAAATRYDSQGMSPPPERYSQPAGQDRYAPQSSYLNSGASPAAAPAGSGSPDRYSATGTGLPPAASNSTAPATGLPDSAKANADRYGTGVQGGSGDDRYKNSPDPYQGTPGMYQSAPPAGSESPSSTQPGATPSSSPQGAPGEFYPGSIKRYSSPTGTTSNDRPENVHFFVGMAR